MMEEQESQQPKMGRVRYISRVAALLLRYFIDTGKGIFADLLRAILRAPDLFLGTGLLLLGVLNFNIGRYCDGNVGAYLSCTRPAVYYYFDGFDIALIIIGVFLVLTWFVKKYERA